jgi:hypothetical protein
MEMTNNRREIEMGNAAEPVIQIRQLDAETIAVPIVGTAPLIVHNWSEKSRKMMLGAMQGKKNPKEVKNPEAEYEASMYRIYREPKGRSKTPVEVYGFPAIGFKAATIGAARFFDKSVSMASLKQFLYFKGEITKADPQELVEIVGKPEMREDAVKVGVNGRDLRYRAQFYPWTATLIVTYVKSSIDRASVLSLIDAGGLGCGIGEWRPNRNGAFGTYAVDQSKPVKAL